MKRVIQAGKPGLRFAAKWGLRGICGLGVVFAGAQGARGSTNGHTGISGAAEEICRDMVFAELIEDIVFPRIVEGADGCGEIVGLGGFSKKLRTKHLKTYRWRRYGINDVGNLVDD